MVYLLEHDISNFYAKKGGKDEEIINVDGRIITIL